MSIKLDISIDQPLAVSKIESTQVNTLLATVFCPFFTQFFKDPNDFKGNLFKISGLVISS